MAHPFLVGISISWLRPDLIGVRGSPFFQRGLNDDEIIAAASFITPLKRAQIVKGLQSLTMSRIAPQVLHRYHTACATLYCINEMTVLRRDGHLVK